METFDANSFDYHTTSYIVDVFNGLHELLEHKCSDPMYNVLSLDGGGIRGLILAMIIEQLESDTGR